MGVRHHQLALQLGEHGQHPEHGPSFGGRRVDAVFDDVQVDAAFARVRAEKDQMQNGATEPVEAGHLQRVAASQDAHEQVERADALGVAGSVKVEIHPVDAKRGEGRRFIVADTR